MTLPRHLAHAAKRLRQRYGLPGHLAAEVERQIREGERAVFLVSDHGDDGTLDSERWLVKLACGTVVCAQYNPHNGQLITVRPGAARKPRGKNG